MVRSEMRKLERQETTAEIKRAIKKNDDLAAEERLKTVIRKLIDKLNRRSAIDVVETPSGPLTDPEEMSEYLTGEWGKKFSHPEDFLPH
jgi:enoyl reductase-like protein